MALCSSGSAGLTAIDPSHRTSYASHGGATFGRAGLGWHLNYESELVTTPCGELIVTGAEDGGQRFAFDREGEQGTLVYRPLLGHNGSLIVQADGAADFYSVDGTCFHFGSPSARGRLLDFIEGSNGNRVRLWYPAPKLGAGCALATSPGDSPGRGIP